MLPQKLYCEQHDPKVEPRHWFGLQLPFVETGTPGRGEVDGPVTGCVGWDGCVGWTGWDGWVGWVGWTGWDGCVGCVGGVETPPPGGGAGVDAPVVPQVPNWDWQPTMEAQYWSPVPQKPNSEQH